MEDFHLLGQIGEGAFGRVYKARRKFSGCMVAIKMISTVILIQFVFCWNDFQTINLYLPTHPTLAYGIWWMQSLGPKELRNNTPIRITTCMMLALPILIIFVVLKDKLMGNVSMGGLKE